MTAKKVRYYAMHSGIDGTVIQICRITWDSDGGMAGEYWHDGDWVENDEVIRKVMGLVLDDITEELANALIASES